MKLGISLGQGLSGAILKAFSPLLRKQVAVLGQKGQVSLAAFALLQCRQQERLGCLCLQDLGLKCGI